jgi:hypothetical protein
MLATPFLYGTLGVLFEDRWPVGTPWMADASGVVFASLLVVATFVAGRGEVIPATRLFQWALAETVALTGTVVLVAGGSALVAASLLASSLVLVALHPPLSP